MDENNKVFSSNITRGQKILKNNLQDLIDVVPAVPSTHEKERKDHKCEFTPKNDKYYVPKKRNKFKVKTVRDIRNVFEKDVYSYLPNDLDRQHNVIFKKITRGNSKNDNTKILAKNILKSENPISRSSWQMLMNLNPDEQANCVQYVFWNGKRIRVNGSKGGKSKFFCNFDLARKNVPVAKKKLVIKKTQTKRKLLNNSLTVKFKPGPLTKKKFLDDSYQKYNVGSTELVKLPKLGLDIQPTYGLVLEPSINNFLQGLCNKDGTISEKWAEFSVSVLGSWTNNEVVQNDPKSNVTFDLNYKSNQRRILMRRDIDSQLNNDNIQDNLFPVIYSMESDSLILSEIETIVENMLDSVEISLNQDDMFSGVDEQREICSNDLGNFNNVQPKDKVKRNIELERLAVTIIRFPDTPLEERTDKCQKSYCVLGCICASLQGSYNLKQHCGRVDCMFECRCDFSKYKLSDSIEKTCAELIPGILKLNNEINLTLAKEEQKFRQTVVMTGERSILMRSQRRNWKTSKKYADFYQGLSLKPEIKVQPVLSVVDIKLDLENVEPWCMIHNLYKCFCKGKFIENSLAFVALDKSENEELNVSDDAYEIRVNDSDTDLSLLCINSRQSIIKRNIELSDSNESTDLESYPATCARTRRYTGRKYYDSYYFKTNKKIEELEKNDQSLYNKMMTLINKSDKMIMSLKKIVNKVHDKKRNNVKHNDLDSNDTLALENAYDNNDSTCSSTNMTYFNKLDVIEINKSENSVSDENSNSSQVLSDNVFSEMISSQFTFSEDSSTNQSIVKTMQSKRLPNKTKLVAWLESSYKQYKQRVDKGTVKTSLEPPKEGKIALYPWEFILSRYRERKNLFLVSNQRPFRIFMAVDMKNTLFKNCINIDDIRFADLHKYPITVKNLLTNATDLKDIFFILSGLAFCWELIGSVAKINKENESESNEIDSNTKPSLESDKLSFESDSVSLSNNDTRNTENSLEHMEQDDCETETCEDKESSKWFVMTIENDFSEIKFYRRGFFVKYESIIKAINVARMTRKTVRLSSQKTADPNEGPQFGIYAIPNINKYCVFIGPYDKDEPLDLETVKSVRDVGKPKNTRGVWITTKKVDNLKVIDNPLSFMPNVHLSKTLNLNSETVPHISNKSMSDGLDNNLPATDQAKTSKKQRQQPKVVKPIKIRKTDGFYHLNPQKFLKPSMAHKVLIPEVPQDVPQQGLIQCSGQNRCIILNDTMRATNPSLLRNTTSTFCDPWPHRTSFTNENNKVSLKPVAEIAPQIKIVNVYSEARTTTNQELNDPTTQKREKGMFILKPEEINKKIMDKQRGITSQSSSSSDLEMNEDIENFLATSNICTPPNPDDLIIYENEEEYKNKKNIFIECKNIEHLGWIRGKRNHEDKISFQFPGFKYTLFYNEEEAFSKINQVLSRKVYIPKNIKMEWRVVDTFENLKTKKMLAKSHLGIDFVLTKRGLRHKRDLMANAQLLSKQVAYCSSSSDNGSTVFEDHVDKASDFFDKLEEENNKVEDESNQLLSEMKEREASLKAMRESEIGATK